MQTTTPPNLQQVRIIEIAWDGPYRLDALPEQKLREPDLGDIDYGLYQIYGHHTIYGPDSLLYIGRSVDRNFQQRWAEHARSFFFEKRWNGPLTVYRGRLGSKYKKEADKNTFNNRWSEEIVIAEAVAIATVNPPYNSQLLGELKDGAVGEHDCLVLSYGNYHKLPPAMSSLWHYSHCWDYIAKNGEENESNWRYYSNKD